MFQVILDLGKLTDWLSIVVSSLALIANLTLLFLTKRNLDLLIGQTRAQSYSQTIEAHKSLFMPLALNEEFSGLLGQADSRHLRKNILSSMMINHASRIFFDHHYTQKSGEGLEWFRQDAADLFSIPLIKARWPDVKKFHDKRFVEFVDKVVMPEVIATAADA